MNTVRDVMIAAGGVLPESKGGAVFARRTFAPLAALILEFPAQVSRAERFWLGFAVLILDSRAGPTRLFFVLRIPGRRLMRIALHGAGRFIVGNEATGFRPFKAAGPIALGLAVLGAPADSQYVAVRLSYANLLGPPSSTFGVYLCSVLRPTQFVAGGP